MIGLLLKDCYTLLKQLRLMLLILVVWACIPNFSFAPFAVFYSAMLPVTALAYDERSKWDELAAMMPYSSRSIVLSKYILGVAAVIGAALLAGAAQLVTGAIRGTAPESGELLGLVFIVCMSLLLLSVNLPLMFTLGVEKGRIAFIILICGGVVASMALRDRLLGLMEGLSSAALPVAAALILTAGIMAVSAAISTSLYQKRRG